MRFFKKKLSGNLIVFLIESAAGDKNADGHGAILGNEDTKDGSIRVWEYGSVGVLFWSFRILGMWLRCRIMLLRLLLRMLLLRHVLRMLLLLHMLLLLLLLHMLLLLLLHVHAVVVA